MIRRTALAFLVAATLIVGIVVACSSQPDVVASFECVVPDAGVSAHPCLPTEYCERESCDSPNGRCVAIDSAGCVDSGVQCGCDGITYYNECLRQEARVSKQDTQGQQCPWLSQKTRNCAPGMECDPGQSCATIGVPLEVAVGYINQLLPDGSPPLSAKKLRDQCPMGDHIPLPALGLGVCWSLPATEPEAGAGRLADFCGNCSSDWKLINGEGVVYPCLDASSD